MGVFATKSQFVFEPGLAGAVAADAVADAVYTTPLVHRETLGDLARLTFRTGHFRYRLVLNQATAAGAATVRLTDGVSDLAVAAVDLSEGQDLSGRIEADLVNVLGNAQLRVEVDITDAADASTTIQVAGVMEVSCPAFVVGSC